MDLFDFGILLQALANNMKVGMLAVRGEQRVKYLQLDRTRLVCLHTDKPKVSLGKVLYHHRAIEKAPLKEAMAAIQREGSVQGLGPYLVEKGLVTPAQLRRANHYQLLEETLELFYWKNVGFKFTSGGTRETLPRKDFVQVGEAIEVDTLLIQCTKTIDDIAKFDEVTPSLRDVYELRVDSLETLHRLVPDPAQREFILLVDGVRDMREVLRDMRMNRFEVLDLFYRFRQEGLIRPRNAFELLMLAENRRKEFSLEKRARVYERINELGVEGFEVILPLAETYEELGAKDKAAALFARQARKCFEAGDRKGALVVARRATELEPEDPAYRELEIEVLVASGARAEAGGAYKALSEIRLKKGDAPGARAALKRAAKLHPADATNWLKLAGMLEESGRTRRAATRLRRAGDALRGAGDRAGAVETYRRALVLCEGAWSVHYRLVEVLHDLGQDDVASRELTKLIRLVTDADTRLDRDARVQHLARVEECLHQVGAMISSVAVQLGRAWAQLDSPERALCLLREAASALDASGRHRGTVEALETLIELDPDDLGARRMLARAHVALGETVRAVYQLRRVGVMLVTAKQWPEAREVYEQMLEADPGSAHGHAGLANALHELGDLRAASMHFHRAALLHRGSGNVDQAVEFFREAVEKNPTDADLLDEFCEVLLATGRRDDKLHALSALVELRMSQNEPARAAIALTRILEIDPRYPGAKNILQEAARQLSCMAEVSEEINSDEAKVILEHIRSMGTTDDRPKTL